MALTDTAIKNAKPTDKPRKIMDEKGLFLLVTPNGGKWWRLRYKFDGKEKLLSLGTYPEVSLKAARQKRDEARELIAAGVDPGENRKAQKASSRLLAANSFEVIAREWFKTKSPEWADCHSEKILGRLVNDVFPWIGSRAITELTAPVILGVLRRIEARGAVDTAHRTKSDISRVLRYAISTGRAERDPCPDLRGALQTPIGGNFASITEPQAVGELMRAIDGFKGTFLVACALRISPMVFVRPGELRQAEWKDVFLDAGEWRFVTSKTKTQHIVSLPLQAVAILKDLHPLTGHGRYVFPGARDPQRPMSGSAINAALRRMGYCTKTEITGHGFRAMARTIIHEELHIEPAVIEHQLAHAVPDALGSAYNRTKFLKERKAMLQIWADYLDKLKAGAEVIRLHPAA